MAPLPDVLPLPEVPVFVEYLLREFGEPSSVPPMQGELSVWTQGRWEVRLSRPASAGTTPQLQVKAPEGWSLRCLGTRRGLTSFRIDADGDTWTRLEDTIHRFWAPELAWLWPPAVPSTWRRFPNRKPTVSLVRHADVIPGAEVLLTGLAPQQPSFALSVSGEGQPLPVTFLGPIGVRASGASERWICELRPGAPLPRLAQVYPGASPQPASDRLLEEGQVHGLLVTRCGGPGRERQEAHRRPGHFVRECRFVTGRAEQVAAQVPEDPAVWTVEWAITSTCRAESAGQFACAFGRSLPPTRGASRTYELLLHGLSERGARGWLERLAAVGLARRERQRLSP
jgi:hypothetical protein